MGKLELDAQAFAAQIAAAQTHAERQQICITKRNELVNAHTIAAARRYLTVYRKALTDTVGESRGLLRSLKISAKANKKLNNNYKNAIGMRTETANQIQIENPQLIIDKARELLQSGGIYKTALGLMLLTGRRAAEILLTAEFATVTGSPKELLFTGQLKTKKEDEINPYKIPTLTPANEIIAAFTTLRTLKTYPAETTPEQINKSASKDLGVYCKKEFGELLGADVKPHDLRKAYAAIAYKKRKEKQLCFLSWAAKVLGHSESGRDSITTYTYLKYIV